MTAERYLSKERFTYKEGDRFVYQELPHPMMYELIDKDKGQIYTLRVKETKKDYFCYADEIIEQADNPFVMYKPAYKHYCIRNTITGINHMITKKQTCEDVCNLLNNLYENCSIKNNGQKWIDEIKSFTGETNDASVIQFCLSYTLQSLKHNKDEVLNKFKWKDC